MTPDTQQPPAAAAAATLVAMLGPLAGQHVAILLAALAGSMWALAARPTASRLQGAALVLRLVLTASVLAGLAGWVLETHLGIPARYAPAAAAWTIGAIGDGWLDLIRILLGRLRGVAAGSEQQQQ